MMKPTTKALLGIAGGFSATAPMTATMLALHRLLPPGKQYPLPPREITAKLLKPANEQNAALLTLAAHFSFGTAMGLSYALATPKPTKNWGWKGCLAGLVVWGVNYCLILPLLNVLRPAHKHPPERNWLMIIAHLVWGLTTAGFLASSVGDTKSRGLFARSCLPHRDRAR